MEGSAILQTGSDDLQWRDNVHEFANWQNSVSRHDWLAVSKRIGKWTRTYSQFINTKSAHVASIGYK
jgi:hypothetical protein